MAPLPSVDAPPLKDHLPHIGSKVKEIGVAWVIAEIESIKHYMKTIGDLPGHHRLESACV